ncbi:cyclopropane-fatty-acyl-phospholipid synthase domain protein [Acidithiobacillus ferrooxidans ATCC 23270]|uniref:Cyclopropane-fatty-acyl-phospholipid synthase domain protein n=2 Tax=Acidithiobacillus ferrooxidans TaxID=920 RepID=B7J6X7_ACIF2|nr:cyclopropane-fatty-acyl-phospholipid synthase domain protein [Acidithiobacillus ferrooxidans ATCC 23270]EGQ64332.1 cyclopropane-fatty-acyl-phospholipid synthase domain protein [Acidithiobacillus sp. GGI-221]
MAVQHLEVLDVENFRPHYAQNLIHRVRSLEEHKEEAIAMVGEKRYRIWAIYVGCRYQYVDRSYREAEVRWEESNGQQGDHWQRR